MIIELLELTSSMAYKEISFPIPNELQLILGPFQRATRVKL